MNIDRLVRSAFDAWSRDQKILAKADCDRALELDPAQSDALHLRGLIAFEEGDNETALSLLRRADSNRPDVLNTLANLVAADGRLEEAVTLLKRALQLEPRYATAQNNLGNTLRELNRLSEAEKCYREVLVAAPAFAEAHFSLGLVLAEQRRIDEAAESYRAAIRHDPTHARSYNNLGMLYQQHDRLPDAISSYEAALAARPNFPEAHNNLAMALQQQGDWFDAEMHYRKAILLSRDYGVAHSNLGTLLHEQGKFDEAIACHQHAAALDPDDGDAHHNLGSALQDAGNLVAAQAAYRKALACDPEHASSVAALHHMFQHDCAWMEMGAMDWKLIERCALEGDAAPFNFLCMDTSAGEQLKIAWAYREQTYAALSPYFHKSPAARTRLRIGYLSSDFREHPVSYLLGEVFELHDRARVEVYAYSGFGKDDRSEARRRIRDAAHHFVDVERLSSKAAARRIHEDGIDILIDLGGHTQHARTGVMALRPAPVQVNYLGYPGTMGAPFIDYIITDRFVTPLDAQPHFSEKFVYMPHCFQPNDRKKAIAGNIPGRKACGLPEEGFVFCSFNKSYKLTPRVFDVWMRLLQAVPGSVLWLSDGSPVMMDNLRREARQRGVEPARLIFASRVDAMAEHLGRQRHADLFLDTLPYNAHTTASDALWAGLPVLTCAGETFASRVAGSLLHAIGLPELVTTSLAEYEALALRLAGDLALLASFRQRLLANRLTTPLFDSATFVKDLERAYELMWENHRQGNPPQLIEVRA